MEEVVDHHRRLTVGGTPAVIVTDIRQAFLRAKAAHPGVKSAPVSTVFPGVYVAIETVQFRMVQMNPIQDTALVVTAEIEVRQPYEVAEIFGLEDNLLNIGDARENGLNEAGRLHPRLVELTHSFQTPLDTDTSVHFFSEIFVKRVDGPTNAGVREGLYKVQVPKDQVAFG